MKLNANDSYKRSVSKGRSECQKKATEWLDILAMKYNKEVRCAVQSTIAVKRQNNIEEVLSGNDNRYSSIPYKRFPSTFTSVLKTDVVDCMRKSVTSIKDISKVCVLNYESYIKPGGEFLKGGVGREESLCLETGLYPCLSMQSEWYALHNSEDHQFVYSNDYIYSRDVPFIVNDVIYFIDVLTMVAPDWSEYSIAAKDLMRHKMEVAYQIPNTFGVTTILLGDWNCSTSDTTYFVAESWKEITAQNWGIYSRVIHPITSNERYKIFKKVLG